MHAKRALCPLSRAQAVCRLAASHLSLSLIMDSSREGDNLTIQSPKWPGHECASGRHPCDAALPSRRRH
jgi:hypothetical protein